MHALVRQINSHGRCIYTVMWTTDWWWKMQASFLVLSEIVSRERVSETTYQKERVRENMSVRACLGERV